MNEIELLTNLVKTITEDSSKKEVEQYHSKMAELHKRLSKSSKRPFLQSLHRNAEEAHRQAVTDLKSNHPAAARSSAAANKWSQHAVTTYNNSPELTGEYYKRPNLNIKESVNWVEEIAKRISIR